MEVPGAQGEPLCSPCAFEGLPTAQRQSRAHLNLLYVALGANLIVCGFCPRMSALR